MLEVQVGLSITPANAPSNAPNFVATVTLSYTGDLPTGTLTLSDSQTLATVPISGNPQQIPFTLANAITGASYLVEADYSGDSIYSPAKSLAVYLQIVGPAPAASASQAVARVVCSSAAGPVPSRTDRENGVFAAQQYKVSSIAIDRSGSGQYDSFTVATLFGKVAGVATRQTLTVALDSNGGIAGLSGFDSTTGWDAPPRLTVTRWDGSGQNAAFLGT